MILALLNTIAKTDSTNAKLDLLKVNQHNETLKRVYRLTYHPQLQYGIKKIPDFVESKSDFENVLENALDFIENKLATRSITGNAAISSLSSILSTLSKSDAEVVCRIIKRDLECGASSTMANKVWKNLIPKQPQMLASAYSEKALKDINYPAYAQLKADGARCFAEIRGVELDDVKLLSRAGNEYHGLIDLKLELIELFKQVESSYPEGICVDGELVYIPEHKKLGLDFLMDDKPSENVVAMRSESNGIANKSLKKTITQIEAQSMSFQVWDLIPLNAIYGNEKSSQYSVRFFELKDLVVKSTRLILIENTLVFNIEQAREIYKSYVEKGLEGIILKNRESVWENKRSKNLLKFKEEIMVDLRVVDVQVHSKDSNKLGAIICESDDKKIRVKCGSGFSDTTQTKVNGQWIDIPFDDLDELNRTKIWKNKDALIGQIVEIKCNGWVTAEGRTSNVSLFLPIIQKIRYDKTETNTFEEAFPDATFPH